jgi:hypothetical protein
MIVGQVGGGVTIDPQRTLGTIEFLHDEGGKLKSTRDAAAEQKGSEKHPWWWD